MKVRELIEFLNKYCDKDEEIRREEVDGQTGNGTNPFLEGEDFKRDDEGRLIITPDYGNYYRDIELR